MKKVSIVGGGVAGIYSAIFLKKLGYEVTLIESSSQIGGLLKSVSNENGVSFDCGSHYLRDTGIKEIDDEVYTFLDKKLWRRFKYLKAGTYSYDQFYDRSCFVNANHLDEETRKQGIYDLMNLQPDYGPYKNCADFLYKRFGKTFTEKLFREPVEKFFNDKIENLSWMAPASFDLVRVICFTPEITRELKKSEWFDTMLAFHFSDEGQAGVNNYYPVKGGIGQWVDEMQAKLDSLGVNILTNSIISQIQHEDKNISSLLVNGEKIETDYLIWSAPLPALLHTAQIDYNIPKGFQFRTTLLFDFVFDKPFKTSVYHCANFDKTCLPFRTAFYSNIHTDPDDVSTYSCTVEVLCNYEDLDNIKMEDVILDLKKMRVVEEDAVAIYKNKRHEKSGFPVRTLSFDEAMTNMRNFTENQFSNLLLIGKAAGREFFQNRVLVDSHHVLKKNFC